MKEYYHFATPTEIMHLRRDDGLEQTDYDRLGHSALLREVMQYHL